MAFEIRVILTLEARNIRAYELANGGPGITITDFSVGTGGVDPINPNIALPPIPNETSLINEIFNKVYIPENITFINSYTPVFSSVLNLADANDYTGNPTPGTTLLGELGIFATVQGGGSRYLHAIAHFPQIEKNSTIAKTFNIILPN